MSEVLAPISVGELIDKITILEIKLSKASDDGQKKNIRHEHEQLEKLIRDEWAPVLAEARPALSKVNQLIWDLEALFRTKHHRREYDEEFISSAVHVFQRNDERAAIKRRINLQLGSDIIEEKIYHVGGEG